MPIVSLDDVLQHLNMEGDESHSAELVGFIGAAEEVVEGIVGPVETTAPITEWHDGGRSVLILRHAPVAAVTSVTEYPGGTVLAGQPLGGSYSANGYTVDLETGILTRRTAAGSPAGFPCGAANVKVVYTAGRTTVPRAVRMAVLTIVQESYQPSQQGGHPGFDEGVASGGRKALYVSQDVKDMLQEAGLALGPSIG